VITAAAIVVLAGGFAWWRHSLYSGDNLGMQYRWLSSTGELPQG
jgi:hypothetical protein